LNHSYDEAAVSGFLLMDFVVGDVPTCALFVGTIREHRDIARNFIGEEFSGEVPVRHQSQCLLYQTAADVNEGKHDEVQRYNGLLGICTSFGQRKVCPAAESMR
jgi:hypothetical protein